MSNLSKFVPPLLPPPLPATDLEEGTPAAARYNLCMDHLQAIEHLNRTRQGLDSAQRTLAQAQQAHAQAQKAVDQSYEALRTGLLADTTVVIERKSRAATSRRRWTEHDVQELVRMFKTGVGSKMAAQKLTRSRAACVAKFRELRLFGKA